LFSSQKICHNAPHKEFTLTVRGEKRERGGERGRGRGRETERKTDRKREGATDKPPDIKVLCRNAGSGRSLWQPSTHPE
jgi:hypothetical protein